MAKEKPKTETEEQTAIRKEIRKEWGQMEPRLIEMAPKLEDSKLIDQRTMCISETGFLVWQSTLIGHSNFFLKLVIRGETGMPLRFHQELTVKRIEYV